MTEFGDFEPGRPAAAAVAVQFALVDVGATSSGLVFGRTIARRVPLERSSPDGLMRGFGRGVSEILSELAVDLRGQEIEVTRSTGQSRK